jgi:hypothetical protein
VLYHIIEDTSYFVIDFILISGVTTVLYSYSEKKLDKRQGIIPQATMEMGLVHLELGKLNEANNWLSKAAKNHSGYYTEVLIRIRILSAKRKIKEMKKAMSRSR